MCKKKKKKEACIPTKVVQFLGLTEVKQLLWQPGKNKQVRKDFKIETGSSIY